MRILLYVCAALLVANVVAFLWPDKANVAPHVSAPKKEVNPHFVRLNKEIEEKFYSQAAISIDVDEEIAAAAVSAAVAAGQSCYRIGPFMHKENYELAQAVLLNAGVEYRKSKRTSKSSNVFRVFLGPYASQPEVADARVDLDHFVRKQDDGEYIISLGIYSTEETADTAVRLFDGKLDEVKKQSETVVLPDSFWLHFPMAKDSLARQQLASTDWGEQSAKMGLYSCDSQAVLQAG